MLKHKELLEQLTIEQKIALLVDSDAPSKEQIDLPQLPRLRVAELWEGNEGANGVRLFPNAEALANSWDPTLFAEVSEHLVNSGMKRGSNLFILPETKAPCSVYGDGLADDPVLISSLMQATSHALRDRGAGVCVHAPTLVDEDVKGLQGEVDIRMLYDRVAMPFHQTVENTHCQAILLPNKKAPKQYEKVDALIMHDELPEHTTLLCANVDAEHTVPSILQRKLLMGGSAAAIQTAFENFCHIRRSVEDGSSTVEELNAALADGAAISEDMINEALEQRLELASTCQSMLDERAMQDFRDPQTEARALEDAMLRAARESIVLLKNEEKTLPLPARKKIALIGDIITENTESALPHFAEQFTAEMSAHKHRFVGFAKGYRLERDRSEELIGDAVHLARNADVVVLFMGMGKRREAQLHTMRSLQLPANQLALFDALSKIGKPIITVIVGNRLPAMAFDRRAKAVLLIPGEGEKLPVALAEVLDARYNPSGRLTFEGQDQPDIDYREAQKHIRAGKKKTGPMIGYRYSVSEKMNVKYPFGFGLSYSEVVYSGLELSGGVFRVTLQNKGKYPAIETVQLYAGLSRSAILRPRMELKGFMRVPLRPGERKTIQLSVDNLDVYDTRSHRRVVERGVYEIAVARNAGELNLTASMATGGQELLREKFQLSDYLHVISDIRSNRYVMEGFCKPMKTRATLKLIGTLLVLLTAFVDVLYAACVMLTFFDMSSVPAMAIVSLLLLIGGGVVLGVYNRLHKKDLLEQEKLEKEATQKLFRDAEVVKADALEELFVEEFDLPELQIKRETETYTQEDEGLYAYMTVETELPEVAKQLERFFEERGVLVDQDTVKALLASLMTSRLIILRSEQQGMLWQATKILGEFFTTEAFMDHFASRAQGGGSLLRTKLESGEVRETNVLHAFYAAQNQPDKPFFAGISDVKLSELASLLMPYIRYFSNPLNSCVIKEDELNITVPSNLWFLLGVADGETLEDLEPFVANFAAVVDFEALRCDESAEKTSVTPLNCAELEALAYRSKKNAFVSEDLWKSVDRLEIFVSEHANYHIGNKLFLQMERYLAVYTGCGGEIERAMDSAVSVKLLPAIISLLKGKKDGDVDIDLLQTVESIFGDENVAHCRSMLKNITLQMEELEADALPGLAPLAQQDEIVTGGYVPTAITYSDASEATPLSVPQPIDFSAPAEPVVAQPLQPAEEEEEEGGYVPSMGVQEVSPVQEDYALVTPNENGLQEATDATAINLDEFGFEDKTLPTQQDVGLGDSGFDTTSSVDLNSGDLSSAIDALMQDSAPQYGNQTSTYSDRDSSYGYQAPTYGSDTPAYGDLTSNYNNAQQTDAESTQGVNYDVE